MGIWALIVNLVKIAAYFFDPNLRARKEREDIWRDFKALQVDYRKALAGGKPRLSAQLGKQMQDMRDEYAFISVYEYGTKTKKDVK